jgi:uncharacterized protein (UPF0332 family)
MQNLTQLFYNKALRGIETAEQLCINGNFEASANRAYYACFHAAIAVLARHGITNTQNPHEWVQAQFSATMIHRRKLLPREFNSYLPDIQKLRNTADYTTIQIGKKQAHQQLKQAQSLIAAIKATLEN